MSIDNAQLAEKGFLDYKLQAETAMADMPLAMEALTEIINQVAKGLNVQTEYVGAARGKSTKYQLTVTKRSGEMLDVYSRRLNKKVVRLESVELALREGLLG